VAARHLKPAPKPGDRVMMCLLIAAHDEEMVLEATLRSALAAGMKPEHIYVVDDNSSDATSQIARSVLPRENVMKVQRSGKGVAIAKAAKKFALTSRYRWIHIADADGGFSPDYFTVFRKKLRVRYAAATGYVKSLPGKRISEYRVYEYTMGMELHRRIQSLLGVISIIPGPTSCFRADVFEKLDFTTLALTEDFDVTLQLHRQGLGKIQFIPEAVAYTQDPLTVKAFINQITRWNRGVLQGMKRHNVGKKLAPIDAYLSYQLIQSLLLFVNIFIWVPYMTATGGGSQFLATTFVLDVMLTFFINLLVAAKSKRWDVLSAFPIIYALKWVSLSIFIKAFVEVMILRKFRISKGYWDNEAGRRYHIQPA
jgi:cellulose synthase/poly-beta-1,6-N-acetylglucosamine synthase-like glycosyltransferase